MTDTTDWTKEKRLKLSALWHLKDDNGKSLHSTADIARQLGVSKNAVVGKAHRLNFQPRPSPIRKAPGSQKRETKVSAGASRKAASAIVHGDDAPVPRYAPPAVRMSRSLGKNSCCYPIGEPGKPSFHFCGGLAAEGKPYCPEHCDIAYVPRSKQGEVINDR